MINASPWNIYSLKKCTNNGGTPYSVLNYGRQTGCWRFNKNYGGIMKFWALAGFLASAVVLTAFVRQKQPKPKPVVMNPDDRYGIEEFLTDLDD